MTLEILATWLGMVLSLGAIVFNMGKQSQKITNLEERDKELADQLDENKLIPIELATLKVKMEILLMEIQEMKKMMRGEIK